MSGNERKKTMNAIKSFFALAFCLFISTPAFAAVDLTGVTLDDTTPQTLAATVLVSLGIMWGIRKLVKLINRS